MDFDAIIISEDKYLCEGLSCELSCLGFSSAFSQEQIGEESIIIYDASSSSQILQRDNSVIYIFDSEMPINISDGYTVFIKPFQTEELIRTFIRLKFGSEDVFKKTPEFALSVSDTFLILCGKRIDLTRNEMIIFNALWQNKGSAVGREHLDEITKANSNGNMVTVYINRLREKISSVTDKKIIVTVRDKGYMIPHL